MIPGWTHNIINLSDTGNLVTVMTCNEVFNPEKPDTFFEPVQRVEGANSFYNENTTSGKRHASCRLRDDAYELLQEYRQNEDTI